MASWHTESTEQGSIIIHDWEQNWKPGQIVSNPLRGKTHCALSKSARSLGYEPKTNLLESAKRLKVVYCGRARGFTDDCSEQVLPVSGNEVEVEIVE